MFDHKSEFLNLVAAYPLDDLNKITLAQKLEDAFVQRLQSILLTTLADENREAWDELFASKSVTPEEFFNFIYNNIEDVDQLVEETFENFKKEFQQV